MSLTICDLSKVQDCHAELVRQLGEYGHRKDKNMMAYLACDLPEKHCNLIAVMCIQAGQLLPPAVPMAM